jgi:hypothetical protein
MPISVDIFLDTFPEFASVDFLKIEETVNSVPIETCGYSGIESEPVRDRALLLHIAHLLEVYRQASTGMSDGRQVKKYKSNRDEIEYQDKSEGLNSTIYGSRLQELLNSQFLFICL